MINVAVVDNESRETEHLRSLLMRYSKETEVCFNVTSFNGGIHFVESCRSVCFDLVFLDVDMPDMDGFETARRLRETDSTTVLIFVTNIARHAIRGYEVNALDYIVKPLSYEAFFLKLPKALAQCRQNSSSKIAVKTRNGQSILPLTSIVFVESSGHRITYHTEQGEFPSYGTMKEVEATLPARIFFRCNSGCIVNLAYVTGCDNSMLSLMDGGRIEISRARKKDFLEALQRYYFVGGR